jgi:hypothetical protein
LLVKLDKLEVGAAQAGKLDVMLLKLGKWKDRLNLCKLKVMLSKLGKLEVMLLSHERFKGTQA